MTDTKKVLKPRYKRPKTFGELVSRIKDRTIRLSYSSFKAFTVTPNNFIKNFLGEFKQTDAMIRGILEHTMVLEPGKVDKKFFVMPKIEESMNSTAGRLKALGYLREFAAVKRSTIKDKEKRADWDAKVKLIETYGEAHKELPVKSLAYKNLLDGSVTSQEDWDFAKRLVSALEKNNAAGWLMGQSDQYETWHEWKAFGFDWGGKVDAQGTEVIWDLKRMRDADPQKVRYTIRDMGYDLQAAHYVKGAGINKRYFILAYDQSLNITVMEITPARIEQAWETIEDYMQKFKHCSAFSKWNDSYDFHSRSGLYEY